MKLAYSLLNIKSFDEDQWIFEGIATTPTPDRVDDVVEPKGAELTLPVIFLWQHNKNDPVGHVIDWSKWNDNLEKIMSKLRDFIELLNSVKDKVINFVQKIVSDPVSAVKEVVDTAKDALTNINNGPTSEPVKAINETSKNIVDTAKGAIQKAKEVVLGGAKIINDEVKTTVAHSRIGKELKLSESDIIDIMKVASTEVVGSLKGKNFENQAAGVVDTILNRAASGKFGDSVRDVINQKNAFSDINAKRKSAYGSVQNVPMSRVSKRMEKFIRDYI